MVEWDYYVTWHGLDGPNGLLIKTFPSPILMIGRRNDSLILLPQMLPDSLSFLIIFFFYHSPSHLVLLMSDWIHWLEDWVLGLGSIWDWPSFLQERPSVHVIRLQGSQSALEFEPLCHHSNLE